MSQSLIGPVVAPSADPNIPAQPTFSSWCVGWEAYDVPRLHDITKPEDDGLGWEQVKGFRYLAILLIDHYSRLRSQYSQLANAWHSPAGEVLLQRLDEFANALRSDAYCASITTTALHGIMNACANARREMEKLNRHWNEITTDWKPEWWDHAAAELNTEAQTLMYKTDEEIRDHRTKIIIPRIFHQSWSDSSSDSETYVAAAPGQTSSDTRRIPPVPGHQPILSSGPGGTGEGLASMPQRVMATPGQPVSMLPIPPGGPYVPYGGAYVLPGPGVGRGGYIVPLPQQGSMANPGYTGAQGGGGGGMVPIPLSAPHNNNGQSAAGALYRRGIGTKWHVRQGVDPVIHAIGDDIVIPNQPSQKQQEEFEDWFAQLAYPWRSDSAEDGREPQVILRRARP